jgi:hypothetical protein
MLTKNKLAGQCYYLPFGTNLYFGQYDNDNLSTGKRTIKNIELLINQLSKDDKLVLLDE